MKDLEVQIQADIDDAGLFATSDIAPGYSEIRYRVRVESTASEEDVLAMLDEADKHSPWLDTISRPVSIDNTQ